LAIHTWIELRTIHGLERKGEEGKGKMKKKPPVEWLAKRKPQKT
jgi:hypothetical protein